jgi:hypothetical protein
LADFHDKHVRVSHFPLRISPNYHSNRSSTIPLFSVLDTMELDWSASARQYSDTLDFLRQSRDANLANYSKIQKYLKDFRRQFESLTLLPPPTPAATATAPPAGQPPVSQRPLHIPPRFDIFHFARPAAAGDAAPPLPQKAESRFSGVYDLLMIAFRQASRHLGGVLALFVSHEKEYKSKIDSLVAAFEGEMDALAAKQSGFRAGYGLYAQAGDALQSAIRLCF